MISILLNLIFGIRKMTNRLPKIIFFDKEIHKFVYQHSGWVSSISVSGGDSEFKRNQDSIVIRVSSGFFNPRMENGVLRISLMSYLRIEEDLLDLFKSRLNKDSQERLINKILGECYDKAS